MICPRCKNQAVPSGDWDKVHVIERRDDSDGGVWVEEAVCCTECGAFLLASPDDEIDPVREGEPYDQSVYHAFSKPPGWKAPGLRVFDREPEVGEWVAIRPHTQAVIEDAERVLNGCEGRVVSIADGKAKVEVNGFSGMMKSTLTELDLDRIKPVVFDTLVPECSILVISGPHKGEMGTYVMSNKGTAEVRLDTGKTVRVPVERLKRLYDTPIIYNE